jgi:hypothetical protein
VSFRPKYPADNALPPGTPDVGGEYAVYMIAEASERPFRTSLSLGFLPVISAAFGPANLDAPPLCPYTSAVPEMDVILNPRAAPPKGCGMGRGWQRILQDVAAL